MKSIGGMAAALVLLGTVQGAHAADTVKIGMVMPLSGWFQPIDASTINGALLAVKEINAAGGVLGQQIEVETFDNKSEPLLGADGATQMVAEGVKAMIVPSDFDFGAPGAFVAQQNGIISFSGASDPKFGVAGIGNLAYSLSTAGQAQGALLAEWGFEDQGWKTAYVLLDNTISYTKTLCGSFTERWKELAGEEGILGEDTFLNGDPSIDAQVSRITGLGTKPDVVLLCSYAPGGPSAIRQLRSAGVDAPIITGESMDGDYWAGTVPGLSDFYVVNFGSLYGDDTDPAVADFYRRYEAEYGERADVSYAQRGYAMIEAWARAAEKAGSVEPAEVAAALDTFRDEPLVVGPTTFTPELHIATTRPMTILKAEAGKFSIVGKFSADEVELD
ncbi:ABC transporter substrate-binding protein [Paracoccus sp. S-4012]|uniref:ABC transporter substrate-binding protein n=1 Tax=Paracoccus sp. S-4012 TaxID=2665648 RepID=UPI0012AFA811|nr:ABC transporter substrate-binding protein [Paracoccus sp. S-4012]MRX52276.1 ABC transporter substrate-binding protein [Paracoccus sp. S-4012]